MRTTISIPDELAQEARQLAEGRSLSELIRQALREAVERPRMERLAQELAVGYRCEAQTPSLDREWTDFDVEGL